LMLIQHLCFPVLLKTGKTLRIQGDRLVTAF